MYLSGKIADLHKLRGTTPKVTEPQRPINKPRTKPIGVKNEGEISKKMFGNFREDVEQLGISAMDFKSRKHVENEKLVSLGMRPIKGHRIPASLGIGMAKAQEKRKKQQIEEARMQGLKVKKAIKKRAKDKCDLGVMGMPGKYSAGVFHLNKAASTKPKHKTAGKGGKKNNGSFGIKVPGMS